MLFCLPCMYFKISVSSIFSMFTDKVSAAAEVKPPSPVLYQRMCAHRPNIFWCSASFSRSHIHRAELPWTVST